MAPRQPREPEHPNTHIGEKFKRQFGAVFTNPKDKGQTTTSDVYGSSIQSSSRLLACVYNIIFSSSFWGSDRQANGHQLLTCLVSSRVLPLLSSPCASFLSWPPWFCYSCLRLAGTSMSPSSRARHFRPPPFVFLFFPRSFWPGSNPSAQGIQERPPT